MIKYIILETFDRFNRVNSNALILSSIQDSRLYEKDSENHKKYYKLINIGIFLNRFRTKQMHDKYLDNLKCIELYPESILVGAST